MKKKLPFFLLIAFLVLWSLVLQIISPEQLVQFIGIGNIYVVSFILAVLVGGSSITAAPLYILLLSFISGGASFWSIVFIAATGSMVGDSLYYLLGRSSTELFNRHGKRILKKIHHILEKHERLTPLVIFLYAAFMPIPNDFLTVSLGISAYTYRKMIVPLFLGNIIYFAWILHVGGIVAQFFS